MIKWDTIKNFHVIRKLDYLLGKWFKVDLLYIDEYGKVQKDIFQKGHQFKNHFLKVQVNLNYGVEYLAQDIEKSLEILAERPNSESPIIHDTYFEQVKTMIRPLFVDGENAGFICVYPFLSDRLLAEEERELSNILADLGVNQNDAINGVRDLFVLEQREVDYISELLDLVANEITTYQSEILRREERISELNSEVGAKFSYHSIIGQSKKMQQLYLLLEKVSKSESTILIQGENGTGKELVAKAIHYQSPRNDKVFIAQNCSAFNDNLLDSELFGHVKGSFTGAVKDKKGLFEVADGGTLFLDEIGDTSLSMQVKLLRVLQEGTFLPVGATNPKKVNVRVIAATNRNLKQMVESGEFREDLYYRINVINVAIPPLRERKEDIPILTEHFFKKRCEELSYPTKVISKEVKEKLMEYPWPGNVRELENEVERILVLMGNENFVDESVLSSKVIDFLASAKKLFRSANTPVGNLKEAIEALEIGMITDGLKKHNFNKSKLARVLGISRANLIMKIDRYGLDKRRNQLKVG